MRLYSPTQKLPLALLALWLCLAGCQPVTQWLGQNSSPRTAASGDCPPAPTTPLQPEDVKTIDISRQAATESGQVSSRKPVGFLFAANAGDRLRYRTSDDICIWLYTPSNDRLDGSDLPETGNYILQVSVPQGSTTFEIALSLSVSGIDLRGSWQGHFSDLPATLAIENQSGKTFTGRLDTFASNGARLALAIRGQTDRETRTIRFQETQILSQSRSATWHLGENQGRLAADGQTLSGQGTDTQGNPYSWSFARPADNAADRPPADRFIKDHYLALNRRQYDRTWNDLSPRFQQVSSGYSGYVQWWDSVREIEIGTIALIEQHADTAQVDAQLQYRMRDGRTSRDTRTRIYLLWNDEDDRWLFHRKVSPP